MPEVNYPFDPTGRVTTNYIVDEQHIVTSANHNDYFFIVPKYAPFFSRNIVVKHYNLDEVKTLVEGSDYHLALNYLGATRSIGEPIYGAISLFSTISIGVISVSYQTLGGPWCADMDYILRVLAEKQYNPRLVAWDQITNIQETFPPINHEHNFEILKGYEDLIDAIVNLSETIVNYRDQAPTVRHLVNYENPHQTTLEQLGYSVASDNLALLGEATNVFITPKSLKHVVDYNVDILTRDINDVRTNAYGALQTISDHLNDFNNPHRTTLAQLGYSVTTDGSALLGEVDNEFITPKSLKYVIDYNVNVLNANLNNHLTDLANPHQTTLDQLGYSVATNDATLLGEATDSFITPSSLKYVLTHSIDQVNGDINLSQIQLNMLEAKVDSLESTLDAHIANYGNPHQTVVGQLGYPVATDQQILDKTPTNSLITLKQVLDLLKSYDFNEDNINWDYNITPAVISVLEGTDILFTVTTKNLPDNSILYWTIGNTTTSPDDFYNNQGTVTIVNNIGNFRIDIKNDIIQENLEFFNVKLRTDSISGPIVAISNTVTITNVVPDTSYSIALDTSTIKVDEITTVTITGENVEDNYTLYWTIKPLTIDLSYFINRSGIVTFVNNQATFDIGFRDNIDLSVDRSFKIQIRKNSITGNIVSESDIITLKKVITPTDVLINNDIFRPDVGITAESLFLVHSGKDSASNRHLIKPVKEQSVMNFFTAIGIYDPRFKIAPDTLFKINSLLEE